MLITVQVFLFLFLKWKVSKLRTTEGLLTASWRNIGMGQSQHYLVLPAHGYGQEDLCDAISRMVQHTALEIKHGRGRGAAQVPRSRLPHPPGIGISQPSVAKIWKEKDVTCKKHFSAPTKCVNQQYRAHVQGSTMTSDSADIVMDDERLTSYSRQFWTRLLCR